MRLPASPASTPARWSSKTASSVRARRQSRRDEFPGCEGAALGRRHEDFTPYAVPPVVHRGVEFGEVHGRVRAPGEDRGPDFRTDRRAHAVRKAVVEPARDGRVHAVPQIADRDAVFVAPGRNVAAPEVAEGGGIQVEPALPEPGQPDQLHFKVVVRDVLAQPDRLRRQVRTIGNAFERHADRAAEAFAGPAAGDSFTQVETHLVGSFGLPLSCRNALNTASA